ncbi:MAG: tRNA-Thr(GGU) m(6)t(6)A37 methyltransferase TsaA [Firmicutes bacterium ML8_F2]|jgi:tRNA (adenine37-N6)-methyltransferase|nr:MAG: tRNA-Thr(GGU) m(6)t(6)A37 methyltransferase TsaA [Firmicutes bacterium ML8_F2]
MFLKPIGTIYSPYKKKEDAPSQGRLKENTFQVKVFEEYLPCMKDLETASHLIVLYWADQADRDIMQTNTPFDDKPHGVFATRSPNRPNPINFNVVDLIRREGNTLYVKGMDALDNSPLLDIKPYSSEVDSIPNSKLGWRDKA